MVPELPNITNNPVELVELVELVLLSSLLAHEIRVRLKRNTQKIMSIYLTWFTIGGFLNI